MSVQHHTQMYNYHHRHHHYSVKMLQNCHIYTYKQLREILMQCNKRDIKINRGADEPNYDSKHCILHVEKISQQCGSE